MAISTFLSVITLNVNGLNAPIKSHRLARDFLAVQWLRLHTSIAGGIGLIPGLGTKIPHATQHSQKNKDPSVCCLQKTHFRAKDPHRLKVRDRKRYCMQMEMSRKVG